MVKSILSAADVSHVYPMVRGSRSVEALKQVALDIPAGQFCSVVGKSGCGKTTLLRILAGLVRPTAGHILFDGEKVVGPSRELAVVFQDYSKSLLPWRTVSENVRLSLLNLGLPRSEENTRVETYLNLVGLSDSANSYPWQLSGGCNNEWL